MWRSNSPIAGVTSQSSLRRRVAAAQFVEHRQRVDDVADRRQFDQQDFAKVAAAQFVEGEVEQSLLSRGVAWQRLRTLQRSMISSENGCHFSGSCSR